MMINDLPKAHPFNITKLSDGFFVFNPQIYIVHKILNGTVILKFISFRAVR